jgi:carbon-monoxide dehydrogenase iron sulfur subunit
MKRIWVDKDKCVGCKTCEIQCAVERQSVSKTLTGAVRENPRPVPRVRVSGQTGFSLALQCRHCTDALCVMACPSGAMARDPETGVVAVDAAKCRGCWMCVMACPIGAVVPSGDYHVAMKCDACTKMEEPACVAGCPTGALICGEEDDFRRILAVKRRQYAMFVRATAGVGPTGVDFINEEADAK